MFVSKHNSMVDYKYVIDMPESQYLERKSFRDKPTDIADDIIAMANWSWWLVVVWIHKWKLDYMPISNTRRNDYLQIAIDFINPQPRVHIETIEIDDKRLLLYHIDINNEYFYERKDSKKVFVRYWDETRELNHYEIENLKYDKNLRNYEDSICLWFDKNDFRISLIEHYKKNSKFQLIVWWFIT